MSMVGNSGLIIKVIINLSILIGHINMLKFCNPFRYALYLNISIQIQRVRVRKYPNKSMQQCKVRLTIYLSTSSPTNGLE